MKPEKEDGTGNAGYRSSESDDQSVRLPRELRAAGSSRPAVVTEDHVELLLNVRRARESVFGAHLFSDHAWDIVLELYAASFTNQTRSQGELARLIGAPQSVIIRWIHVLEDAGLVAPDAHERDPHGQNFRLTENGAGEISKLAAHFISALLGLQARSRG